MNEKEGLNLLDYLATGINKEDPVILAILSDESGKGAIANEAESVVQFIDYYTRTDNVINHKGRSLEMIVKLFTKLRRRISETDEILLRRMLAITGRKHDDIWGNALNLKHVFETYFKGTVCYVAENTNANNILSNGDFELDDTWEMGGGADYSYNARFSMKRGLCFYGGAGETCAQQLEQLIRAGNYTFHFFLDGKCGLIIEREDGKYWNANEQKFTGEVVLEWVDDEVINVFENPDGWDNACCCIKIPEDMNKITIKFVSFEGGTAHIDYARLFMKPLNPSYTLIFHYDGDLITKKTLHLGVAGEDPIQGINYDDERYFDHAFIVGPVGISQRKVFKDVLDMVRPCGIQAFAEFVDRSV